ncbi:MAG: GNAT family N-acetyltransferase [Pseudomonadota bacterium]
MPPTPADGPGVIAVRPAGRAEARTIARLTDMAGEGLPSHLWSQMAGPGEDALSVGAARAARCAGVFSGKNARMATWHGAAVGVVIDYGLEAVDRPGPDVPSLLRPLCDLEVLAGGTHYVNVLAVCPEARRRGVARALIADAAARAGRDLTLTVASGNDGARALYAACGFAEAAQRPMGRGGPPGLSGTWILLRRPAGTGDRL